jgi:hypothetical protein
MAICFACMFVMVPFLERPRLPGEGGPAAH